MLRELLGRHRRALFVVAALLIVSPVFGVILADAVGYHEPLDVAAEKLGLREARLPEWTPFSDYSFPGLPPTLGYIAAGALGVAVILAAGAAIARSAAKRVETV